MGKRHRRHHRRRAAHVDAIRAWLRGELDTTSLIATLESHFIEHLAELAVYGVDEVQIKSHLHEALDLARNAQLGVPELSCRLLLTTVDGILRTLHPSIDAAKRATTAATRKGDAKENITHRLGTLSARLARNTRAAGPPIPPPQWPRDETDLERPDLGVSLTDLAGFFAKMPDEHRSLLRLLALRVVGGWSLREIAKRDGAPLDALIDEWSRARALVQQRQVPFVSVAVFDLMDLHVINTLLADPALHAQLNWRTFERLLASILERFGYEIELRRGTKDDGIDIIALKHHGEFGAHRYLVQAKRWAAKVGIEPVRELLFLRQHVGATKACLATTSTFTAGAWKLANEYQWCLDLRDYARLQDWVHEAFPFLPRV